MNRSAAGSRGISTTTNSFWPVGSGCCVWTTRSTTETSDGLIRTAPFGHQTKTRGGFRWLAASWRRPDRDGSDQTPGRGPRPPNSTPSAPSSGVLSVGSAASAGSISPHARERSDQYDPGEKGDQNRGRLMGGQEVESHDRPSGGDRHLLKEPGRPERDLVDCNGVAVDVRRPSGHELDLSDEHGWAGAGDGCLVPSLTADRTSGADEGGGVHGVLRRPGDKGEEGRRGRELPYLGETVVVDNPWAAGPCGGASGRKAGADDVKAICVGDDVTHADGFEVGQMRCEFGGG